MIFSQLVHNIDIIL